MANNGDALLAAALGGQGIIYQPDFIVGEAIRRGALVTLELDKPVVELGGIHVLSPPDRRPPAKVRVMIDYLAEAFATPQSGRPSATVGWRRDRKTVEVGTCVEVRGALGGRRRINKQK